MLKVRLLIYLISAYVLSVSSVNAQDINNQVEERKKLKFTTFGIGIHSLGLTEFNQFFRSLNITTTPKARYAIYYTRMSAPEGSKVYTGFTVVTQNYMVTNEEPGKISYNFAKQNIDFNVGHFIVDNEMIAVPVIGGAGFSFMIFNSHINFKNDDKDFADVLVNGSGNGIFNMAELSVNGSFITGIDFKSAYFMKTAVNRKNSFNIGLRTGFSYAVYQVPATIAGVTGIPSTDRLNYFVSLNLTRFLVPCD